MYGTSEGTIAGVVESFDASAGLGTVVSGDGVRHPFHCTAIADGTRTIEAGRPVSYRVESRVLRQEAVDIRYR